MTINKLHNPSTVAPPFGSYTHAVEIPPDARQLHISGQVGVKPDGTMATSMAEQTEWAWKNIEAILHAADMVMTDIVKYSTFLTRADDVADYRRIRDQFLGAHRPASTLLIVSALAGADWLVEIEVVAAKA